MRAGFFYVLVLCLIACKPQSGAEGKVDNATTLFLAGKIWTMEPSLPEASAMVVRDGIILAVGEPAQLRQDFPQALEHTLDGALVIPGIVDSHVHVHEMGGNKLKADLRGAQTVAELVGRLKSFFPNPEPDTWLIGQGWDEGLWASLGYPDRAALDLAFPGNPVKLESLHGFAGFYNGRALALAGVDRNTPEPQVGNILRRVNGEPTGVLLTLAQGLVDSKIPPPNRAQDREAILTGLNLMARAGVTSIHEAGIGPERVAIFQELAEEGLLPIRVYGMLNGNDSSLMADWFARGPQEDPALRFSVRGIKVFYDGSLGSRTALLVEDYSDAPEKANMTERITPEKVRYLAEQAAAKKFQMAVHTIGDEGNRRILDIYEQALAAYPELDHRWRLEHAQVVLPTFYERVNRLGVICSMQPSHAAGDAEWAEARLGPERIRHAYAWRSILDAGGRLALGSDLPGEPWEPMKTLYFSVTRKRLDGTPEGGWYPDQTLTVAEALHGMTLGGAHAAFQEQKIGSLAVGKFADFVVLERDPREVPPDSLKDIEVRETWVAGNRIAQSNTGVDKP